MYKGLNIIAVAVATCLSLATCSKDNTRQDEAARLVERAMELRASHDYEGAIAILDSIDHSYREQVDVRHKGMRVRIETIIDQTVDSIEFDERRRGSMQSAVDSMATMFMAVTLPGTEGYKVYKKAFNGSEMNRTCVQPRIDEKGYMFVVANLQGRRIDMRSLHFGDVVAKGNSVSVGSSEVMTLSQEDVAALADAIAAVPTGSAITININGKTTVPVKLSAAEVQAWRDTWHYTKLLRLMETANIRREYYEQQLALMQDRLNKYKD